MSNSRTSIPLSVSLCETVESSFWNRVRRHASGCWEWQGLQNRQGYGKVGVRYRTVGAHRVAYTLTEGEIPQGMLVCHTCDNPLCCRPSHLWLGTHGDNARDSVAKGRNAINGPRSSVTEDQAREIRTLRESGLNLSDIGDRFGVSLTVVSDIVRGRTWKRLFKDPLPHRHFRRKGQSRVDAV